MIAISVVLFLIVLSQAFLGVTLFIEFMRSKRKDQLLFSLLTLTTLAWSLCNFVLLLVDANFAADYVQTFSVVNKIAFFFAALSLPQIYLFNLSYPIRRRMHLFDKVVVSICAILTAMTLTSYVSGSFVINEYGNIEYERGSLLLAIFVITAAVIGRSVVISSQLLLDKKIAKTLRKQAAILLVGLGLTILHSLAFILILPAIFGESTALYALGYFSPFYFIAFTVYGLLRHGLFNVRLIIARAVAYIASLFVLLVLYLVLGFQLSRYLQSLTNNQFISEIVVFASSVIIAVLYRPLKTYFDRVTNRVFYRDAYVAQDLIDQLNQVLVSNVDLETLLIKSSEIIGMHMKLSFCQFYIRPTAYLPERLVGYQQEGIKYRRLDELHITAPKTKKRVLLADDNATDEIGHKLTRIMRANNFEAIARLVNVVDYEVKGVGYIFFGAKKSGSPYSKQDLKIIEIIANEMVIAIENVLRYEEIDKFNVTLQQKIDDATKELKRTNEKLRALDEAKDEFVSMASHQLRTPLTSIKGYVSMVAEEDVGKLNTEQKKMLDQALFSSQRMVYLIADLLNVSRLRTGKFVIEPKPTYLPTIVDSEISQLTEGAASKDITLSFDKPKKFPTLNLDEMKIRQVIMNFTDNAIYYTPSGGKITIALKDKKDSVEFTVKDTGIGVPADERHKLFTKFYRANNARKARPDGTGLGLFMAKKVVVAQGGSIIFESKEGKGSIFGFSFPKDRLEV